MRTELERAEAAQRRAEKALERSIETARRHNEDEAIRLANSHRAEIEARDAELAPLRARAEAAEAEVVRALADGDRLRAHAAALGDELAGLRATVAELQGAAPAPSPEAPALPEALPEAPERPPLERRSPRGQRSRGTPSLPIRRRRAAAAVEEEPPPAPVEEVAASDSGETPAARRTVMRELTAIASTNPDDDFAFRRR
jgi:hypothetical protein